MHLHDRAGTLASLLYKAEKLSVRLQSSLQFLGSMLITQECLHRSKRDLLEMKAVSIKNTKYILTSLQDSRFIDRSA